MSFAAINMMEVMIRAMTKFKDWKNEECHTTSGLKNVEVMRNETESEVWNSC